MRLVYVNQLFNATPATVCDAWLKPEMVKQWLFKSDDNEITDVKIDAREGGEFSVTERTADGDTIEHFGVFQKVECPNLLMFSLEVPKQFEGITTVTVDLQPTKSGCELNFTQTGVSPEVTEDAWRVMLGKLARLVV